MNPFDMFDLVAVQDWTGYKSRQDLLKRELDRVGLLSRAKWFWRFPSPFTPILGRLIPPSERYSLGGFDCTMGHYEIMKLALDWGCKRVLVMEDDACFADTGVIRSAFAELPGDWQFLKLEWYVRSGTGFFDGLGKPWSRFSGSTVNGILCGTGAVAFTREGLKWKTGLMEDCLSVGGIPLHTIDMYDTPEFVDRTVAYCATPCLAVQRPHGLDDPHNHAGSKPYRREFLVGGSLAAGYPAFKSKQ